MAMATPVSRATRSVCASCASTAARRLHIVEKDVAGGTGHAEGARQRHDERMRRGARIEKELPAALQMLHHRNQRAAILAVKRLPM